ncbi:MAG: phosphoglucosamine mutase [Saprospiraceae bacterium]|nr:phosphoglucosamine mutase [Saprospiraceae bacterium]MDW8483176.1 phosphoglucosamine mutase [Saprospiraceae bacterium]
MPLIKSISGFRGTLGGRAGDNLTPQDIVACTAAFGQWVLHTTRNAKIVVGTDGRPSREVVSGLVIHTLQAQGIQVISAGLTTTPTLEMAVVWEKAGGGIVITASHNPVEWNALKLLNAHGEFISAADGHEVLEFLRQGNIEYASVHCLGQCEQRTDFIERHIQSILTLPTVNVEAIRSCRFRVVVDPVNSTGALALPPLLEALGCRVTLINGEVTGFFAHNPEPLPEHLSQLSEAVLREKAHLGIAVDPDVDRLVFISENGQPFGEEYTLVAIADYILSLHGPGGATVSNLSSSRALQDIAARHKARYYAAPVGEVNVVEKMKTVGAVIGGEGNGGVIYPALHYGRDALVGTALFLTHLATQAKSASELRRTYPDYFMVKSRLTWNSDVPLEHIFSSLREKYKNFPINSEDGLKIDFPNGWVHLRPSNTEPIVRLYAEANSPEQAHQLAASVQEDVLNTLRV